MLAFSFAFAFAFSFFLSVALSQAHLLYCRVYVFVYVYFNFVGFKRLLSYPKLLWYIVYYLHYLYWLFCNLFVVSLCRESLSKIHVHLTRFRHSLSSAAV